VGLQRYRPGAGGASRVTASAQVAAGNAEPDALVPHGWVLDGCAAERSNDAACPLLAPSAPGR
jgi:hypothetical protein